MNEKMSEGEEFSWPFSSRETKFMVITIWIGVLAMCGYAIWEIEYLAEDPCTYCMENSNAVCFPDIKIPGTEVIENDEESIDESST